MSMMYPDILYILYNILATEEDAQSMLNLSYVNKLSNRVFRLYPNKYLCLQSIQICKLAQSQSGLDILKKELLDLILVSTNISPMVTEIQCLIRFMHMTNPNINMSNALDRLIPDNTKTGNDMTYDPGNELILVLLAFSTFLSKWTYQPINFQIPLDHFMTTNEWTLLETYLDKFWQLLFVYISNHRNFDSETFEDWYVTYDHYSLYSIPNENNSEKITLYLNKLKVIYQLIN